MSGVLSTQYFSGSVLTPAALAAFCTIPAVNLRRAGVYRIKAQVAYTGTAPGAPEQTVGTAPGNVALYIGGVSQVSVGMPAVAGVLLPFSFMAELDGASSVSLNAILLATTGTQYWGILEADFMGISGGLGEFQE